MRRLTYLVMALTGAGALWAGPASAHNAGCVQTGNSEWVFVGSNKSAPFVPEQNPRHHAAEDADEAGSTSSLVRATSTAPGSPPTRASPRSSGRRPLAAWRGPRKADA